VLKDLYQDPQEISSFLEVTDTDMRARFNAHKDQHEEEGVSPFEEYEAAAAEELPLYRGERAKSQRSTCGKCEQLIAKGAVRFGSLDAESGT
jgi:hypothetical protein